MRLLVDLQGAQTDSRFRGIGRYSLALAQALVSEAQGHEVWFLLNLGLRESAVELQRTLRAWVPRERILCFDVPGEVEEIRLSNAWLIRSAELLREHAVAHAQADMVLITSLFEGFGDLSVSSVGALTDPKRVAVILYDLIPFFSPHAYLAVPGQKEHYQRKIDELGQAGLLLAISQHSRDEAIAALKLAPAQVVAISSAADPHFQPESLGEGEADAIRARIGVSRRIVLCAPGGGDPRKNVEALIKAFARMSPSVRSAHQVVVVSKLTGFQADALRSLQKSLRLQDDELILTGYLSDDDLRALYRAATLFVMPSVHEGFGLPALEAMASGTATIGSNCTSIPEVIGLPEALFDPRDVDDIRRCMQGFLADAQRLAALREHGLARAQLFSWQHTARLAWDALIRRADELGCNAHGTQELAGAQALKASTTRMRMAWVSPAPPARTGIARHAQVVLPALSEHYDIDWISEQFDSSAGAAVAQGWLGTTHGYAWFEAHSGEYDRVVYQMGNSAFHARMHALLERHPGVVVMHDFFNGGSLIEAEQGGRMPGEWTRLIHRSHGYAATAARLQPGGDAGAFARFPANLPVLQRALGIVVHTRHAADMAQRWYGPEASRDWACVPLPVAPPAPVDREAARLRLGIPLDAQVVCCFGILDPAKRSERVVSGWLNSNLREDERAWLVLVGENHGADWGQRLTERIEACGCAHRVRITGWVSDDDYAAYLAAADLAVQLRGESRGESSLAVLECMSVGLPVVVNRVGALAELPEDCVLHVAAECSSEDLARALADLLANPERRAHQAARARAHIESTHSPMAAARAYRDAFERVYASPRAQSAQLIQALSAVPGAPRSAASVRSLAQCMADSLPERPRARTLWIDVSVLRHWDLATGIQRVAKNQIQHLLADEGANWRIEPVELSHRSGVWHYRTAPEWVGRLLGVPMQAIPDEPAAPAQGDRLFCADFAPGAFLNAAQGAFLNAAQAPVLASWRARGVDVWVQVFDLLPHQRPDWFPEGAADTHRRWLAAVAAEADGVVCISEAVAAEFRQWVAQVGPVSARPIRVHANPLGADFCSDALAHQAARRRTLPHRAAAWRFLAVGTIEPRKGYSQLLDAFEHLWSEGLPHTLSIVGRAGWQHLPPEAQRGLPALIQRLRSHPELGRRLCWLETADDIAVARAYAESDGLVAPSEGEGFGLPLVEAGQFGLPVLARDLPVFREVAPAGTHFFSGGAPELARAIERWLQLQQREASPAFTPERARTWADNASELLRIFAT